MSTLTQQEGATKNISLSEWLKKWKLAQYEQKLKDQGIESPQDFKYIKSKQQFDELVSKLGDNIPFMHKAKLQDAWSTIVPINKQQSTAQIFFLGDNERKIMDKLVQRYHDISEDVNNIQKGINEFNESVVAAKKIVNDSIDKSMAALTEKREELLNKIDVFYDEKKKLLNKKLNDVKNVQKQCLYNKQQFDIIAMNTNIPSSKKILKLDKLLTINININNDDNDNDDDEKKVTNDNYDNYKIIGDECVIPGKIDVIVNQQSINTVINQFMSVKCNDITNKWNMKRVYNDKKQKQKQKVKPVPTVNVPVCFDKEWSKKHYTFSNDNKSAACSQGTWPVVRLSVPVNDNNSSVKFIMNGYGWYGVGDHQVGVLGFPGFTTHGWMVRNSNGGMYYNSGGDNKPYGLNPQPGNVQNKEVEMSFDLSKKQLTVKADNKSFISNTLNINVTNVVHFVWTMSPNVNIKLV